MNKDYLVKLVEEFCTENKLDISKVYKKMASIYQDEWGINIDKKMRDDGFNDMALYLDLKQIIDRYVHILNELKNKINNNIDLELNKL